MAVDGRVDAPDARRIAAVLANDDMRTLYAEIVLSGAPSAAALRPATLSPATRKKALAALVRSGLVEVREGGTVSASARVFRDLLAQHPVPQIATGIERFLRGGRIDRYPSSAAERRELLHWIADRTMEPDEVLSETDVNVRLERVTDDVAALRRYLVDAGLLLRTRSGSSYSRADNTQDASPKLGA